MRKKITKKDTSLAIASENKDMTPMALMALAVAKGDTSIEIMKGIMDLQDRHEAKMAKKAFDEAMARFQALCPTIKKDKAVLNKPEKGGGLRYKFAPLDSIVGQVKKILQECGFSYTITAKMEGNQITAICKVTHQLGHSESSSFQVPTDPDAYMNVQQRVGAALTFAKRYAFCNAFGIMTGDEDNDANQAPPTIGKGATATAPAKGQEPENKMDATRMKYIGTLAAKKDVKGLEQLREQISENVDLTNQEKMKYMGRTSAGAHSRSGPAVRMSS